MTNAPVPPFDRASHLRYPTTTPPAVTYAVGIGLVIAVLHIWLGRQQVSSVLLGKPTDPSGIALDTIIYIYGGVVSLVPYLLAYRGSRRGRSVAIALQAIAVVADVLGLTVLRNPGGTVLLLVILSLVGGCVTIGLLSVGPHVRTFYRGEFEPPANAASASPPGDYPVPAPRGSSVLRHWDEAAWLSDFQPDPYSPRFADYAGFSAHTVGRFARNTWLAFWRLLRDRVGMILVPVAALGLIAGVGLTLSGLANRSPDTQQMLDAPLTLTAAGTTLAVGMLLIVFVDQRLRFRQLGDLSKLILWGMVSGVVAVQLAGPLNTMCAVVFSGAAFTDATVANPNSYTFLWVAGFVEEMLKLAIPVLLWALGRFRNPRAGVLLGLLSGITFGVLEAAGYGADPIGFAPDRPLIEMLHPLLTAAVAAVAWRCWWERGSMSGTAPVWAFAAAIAYHSANDMAAGLRIAGTAYDWPDLAMAVIGICAGYFAYLGVPGAYLGFKYAARQHTPPERVADVAPGWRPVLRTG